MHRHGVEGRHVSVAGIDDHVVDGAPSTSAAMVAGRIPGRVQWVAPTNRLNEPSSLGILMLAPPMLPRDSGIMHTDGHAQPTAVWSVGGLIPGWVIAPLPADRLHSLRHTLGQAAGLHK